MGKIFILFLAVIAATSISSASKLRYNDYHVISVNIQNSQQREFVEELDASTPDITLLEAAVVNHTATLVIPPHHLADVKNIFLNGRFEYRVETTNLQK